MPGSHHPPDIGGDTFIANDIFQIVLQIQSGFADSKVKIDPYRLDSSQFGGMDADLRIQLEIADEDMPQCAFRQGQWRCEGRDHGIALWRFFDLPAP